MYQQTAPRTLAKVFSFDIKFTGTKRTMFYRNLFGFLARSSRMDRHENVKTYTRSYPGLLTNIPHAKLGKSVLAVPIPAAPKLKAFFRNPAWQPIEIHIFDAILPPDLRLQAMTNAMATGQIDRENLKDEITALQHLLQRGRPNAEVLERVGRVLRTVDELMKNDWSDGKEFSARLEAQLTPLRKAARQL